MQTLVEPPKKTRRRHGTASPEEGLRPAEQYARDVIDGKIVAGRLVKLACQRYFDDLEHGQERGLFFDRESADIALEFFSLLKHSKGEWAGQTVALEGWQQFIIWNVFGWKKKQEDGRIVRRFKIAYIEVARGNGKTTLLSGVGLKMMKYDGEPASEVYAIATKKDQARRVHEEAMRMVRASPDLRRMLKVTKDLIFDETDHSKFAPLGSDTDNEGEEGRAAHGTIADEVHAHRTRDAIDSMETSMGKRRQPILWMITTAGRESNGVCWDYHKHGIEVVERQVNDDGFFAFICCLDEKDDWKDERNWGKPNPNLGVSVQLADLREKFQRALDMPSAQAPYRQKHLNEWLGASRGDINMDAWGQCGGHIDRDKLKNRPCGGGLDLASTMDLNSLCLCFPPYEDDPFWYYLWWFWAPEAKNVKRERLSRVKYDNWARMGILTLTEGDICDYSIIKRDSLATAAEFTGLQDIGYDPANATDIVQDLERDGLKMVPIRQGFLSLNAPSHRFEDLMMGHQMRHGDNQVATWMAGNLVWRRDTVNGLIMPHKMKSTGKIDGISAAVMATDRAMRNQDMTGEPGIYVANVG